MDRTEKSDNRKQEFLLTALDLFSQKGYEKTTIKDIIDEMGVSKGAFYHYFESKEDIIINIAKEYADKGVKMMRGICERKDLNGIEKLNEIFKSVNRYKSNAEQERSILKGVFGGEENLKLERKIWKSIKQNASPLIQDLIEAGVEEGCIETTNTKELTDFIIYTINGLNSSIDELINDFNNEEKEFCHGEFINRLDQKLRFYEEMLNKILNIKGGSINLREPYLKRFAKKNND